MILAWIGALFIGLSLGLLGSGGSILTVPTLVYLVGQNPKVAIAGSLLIVALISFTSAIAYARQKMVEWPIVFAFGLPGMLGAVLGAWTGQFVSVDVQMLFFGSLLLVSSYLMFKPPVLETASDQAERHIIKTSIDGFLVGIITGLVGVGGGFLIIPALVLLAGLSVRLAIGTSLVIISMQAFAGFVEYLQVLEKLQLSLDWQIIGIFSVIGIVGGLIGSKLCALIDQTLLKKVFGGVLILMGGFILTEVLSRLLR